MSTDQVVYAEQGEEPLMTDQEVGSHIEMLLDRFNRFSDSLVLLSSFEEQYAQGARPNWRGVESYCVIQGRHFPTNDLFRNLLQNNDHEKILRILRQSLILELREISRELHKSTGDLFDAYDEAYQTLTGSVEPVQEQALEDAYEHASGEQYGNAERGQVEPAEPQEPAEPTEPAEPAVPTEAAAGAPVARRTRR